MPSFYNRDYNRDFIHVQPWFYLIKVSYSSLSSLITIAVFQRDTVIRPRLTTPELILLIALTLPYLHHQHLPPQNPSERNLVPCHPPPYPQLPHISH
jgi:hypothetical protein